MLDVRPISYLLYVHHHEAIDLRILLLVETAICQRHICGCCAAGRGLIVVVLFVCFVASDCSVSAHYLWSKFRVLLGCGGNFRGFCRVEDVDQSHNLQAFLVGCGGIFANRLA